MTKKEISCVMQKVSSRMILWSIVVLFATIALCELTNVDLFVQDYLYNFETHQWIVGSNDHFLKMIFYTGIKDILIVIGVCTLLFVLFWRKSIIVKQYRCGLIVMVLSLILVPAFVGLLKDITNMPCPKNLQRYGGNMPHVGLCERYSEKYSQMPQIRCWPAGHASGGFALMSLFFVFKRRRNQLLGLCAGVVVGFSMGLYKMMIGDHFLSHTIISMILALILILFNVVVVKFISRKYEKPAKI